jgi:uncharacterized protein
MVLDLKELFIGGPDVSFDYGMDLSGFETAPGEKPITEPVRVSGKAVSRAGVVTISVEAVFCCHTRCDRCLKSIDEHYDVRFSNILVQAAQSDESDDIIVCPGQTLDVDDLTLTNIILELSMKHLCRPGCRGLCPKCGKDLNEGDCGCEKDEPEGPLSQLRDLIN